VISIPARPGLTFYNLQIPLDGITYTLEIRWSVRESAFYMNVLDESGATPILSGLKLVLGAPIAAKNTGRAFPGFFLVIDTSGQGLDAGIEDLGDRVRLDYFEAADIAAIGGL